MQRARNAMRHLCLRVHHRVEPEIRHGVAVTSARRSEREALMALVDRQRPRAGAALRAAQPAQWGALYM
jgi:hypothetical protein